MNLRPNVPPSIQVDRPRTDGRCEGGQTGTTARSFLSLVGRIVNNRRFFIGATLAPALVLLGVYVFWPIIYSFYLSFFNTILFKTENFAGVDQYRLLFESPLFRAAVENTLYYTVGSTAISMILGLGLALVLERTGRGRAFFQAIFFVPYVVPYTAYALIWYWLFDPQFGFANYVLHFIGLGPVPWVVSPTWVIPSFIIMSVWKRLGFVSLIFLAGLHTIPQELNEAAAIDGVSWFSRLRHITMPLLRPFTLFVLVVSMIYSLQLFIEPYVITQGGPGTSSLSVVELLYEDGFESLNIGAGSAISVLLFIVTLGGSLILMKWFDRRDA
jgi:multiple sugar transport system permease protein